MPILHLKCFWHHHYQQQELIWPRFIKLFILYNIYIFSLSSSLLIFVIFCFWGFQFLLDDFVDIDWWVTAVFHALSAFASLRAFMKYHHCYLCDSSLIYSLNFHFIYIFVCYLYIIRTELLLNCLAFLICIILIINSSISLRARIFMKLTLFFIKLSSHFRCTRSAQNFQTKKNFYK